MKLKCFIILYLFSIGCEKEKAEPLKNYTWETVRVTATAYNSTKSQTDHNPHVGAFGDSLKPGMKYIAVSRDLYRKGMKHNTPVRIEGLKGLYLVKDRMPSRWKNRIDIYMGTNVDSARQWGRKKVNIDYRIELPDTTKLR
ncbi:3D domain-containing protein [Subsaxibacter sp. CAU 1640]|uniref:3D domain-containing protein n=1 Tax=Subsaxibacter sp. CAU 1640 TaxID=2933271 RepID=UPI0021D44B1E|nr:3D domain-containing protein [Subsaxibacter sp. CAU 1640]